jgi:hypothetical protein
MLFICKITIIIFVFILPKYCVTNFRWVLVPHVQQVVIRYKYTESVFCAKIFFQ